MLFDYPRELRTNQALVVGMHAFFVKLGIASPIFIGASDSGMVAQIYTQKYPNATTANLTAELKLHGKACAEEVGGILV